MTLHRLFEYLVLLVIDIVFNLLAVVLVPVLPAFADESGWLPHWLWWFQTPDNPIDGDDGFKTEHAFFRGQVTGWRRYLNRSLWLLRNPAYGFEWDGPMCARLTPDLKVRYIGNPWIKNRTGAVAGTILVEIGDYWGWKRISKPFFKDTCLMMEFGWKLQTYAEDVSRLLTEPRAQFVFSIRLTSFLPS